MGVPGRGQGPREGTETTGAHWRLLPSEPLEFLGNLQLVGNSVFQTKHRDHRREVFQLKSSVEGLPWWSSG